jgi:hypothetical protein
MSPGRSLEGLRFHAQDQVDFRTAYGSYERQTDMWTRPVQFRQAGDHRLPLKLPNSPIPLAGYSTCARTGFLLCPLRFVMATLQSTQFAQFAFPLSNPPFCNNNTLWSSEPRRSIPSSNASGSQKTYRPTAAVSHSRYQIEAERNAAARAEGT